MTAHTDFTPARAESVAECPVCGSKKYKVLHTAGDYEYFLPGTFFVSRCEGCGLLYQNPRPAFQEILRYYTEKYEPFKEVGSPLMRKIRRHFIALPRIRKYRALSAGHKGPVRVLDVGCAHGDLLAELSLDTHFECEGVEPVAYAVDMARKRGLKVHCTTLDELDCADGSYDLLIMNHVLEHLPDPLRTATKAFRVLKKGGVLTGELPCADSFERLVFGRYWNMYHLPRHLTIFSKGLLKRFLLERGFSEVRIDLQPAPSVWQVSARNYLGAKGTLPKVRAFLSGHSVPLNLAIYPVTFLAAKAGYASMMHFTARK